MQGIHAKRPCKTPSVIVLPVLAEFQAVNFKSAGREMVAMAGQRPAVPLPLQRGRHKSASMQSGPSTPTSTWALSAIAHQFARKACINEPNIRYWPVT